MNSAIGLSIIAPCFNEQGNIAELSRRIEEIQNEIDVPLELILVDDGSRDDTWLAIHGDEGTWQGSCRHECRPTELANTCRHECRPTGVG